MSRLTQVIANMTKTIGASGLQLLITLVATPIMTRLYAPEAYATFGIINTAATVIIGIGLLSLPNAYTAQKEEAARDAMLHAMIWLLIASVLCAILVAVLVRITDGMHHEFQVSTIALLFLPMLVLSHGIRQIIMNIGIQRGIFGKLSLGQVLEPLSARGGSILFGSILGGSPVWILFSVMLGHFIAAIWVIRHIPRNVYSHWVSFYGYRVQLRESLRSLGDFVIYCTASQQAQQLIMLGLQLGIASFFSGHLAGQYILAISILTMPVSMIALATAPVVYHHFIDTQKNNPTHLTRDVLFASALYFILGTVILVPVFMFGEAIFSFAFGEVWAHAGRIAGVLSIAYIGTFVLTGVQSIFMVTRRLRLQFYAEILTSIPALIGAVYCFKIMDFDRAVIYLSLIWLLRSLVLLGASYTAAVLHSAVKDN